ncbi:methionyl-tRNA formyltransferase [Luethyella okanaganae]|uniref:Methionyl-tRNA formyltransferase n=1 Tax=Luethyella okanaganae TaxID=69372 RepID=A0ABW1VDX1_9MICO
MRLVFAGTPEAAVPSLRSLASTQHEVVTVITREDAPLGRKRVLTPSPIAQAAAELGLPVVAANRLDEGVTARIEELRPDLGVIVAYGGLVREPLLSSPRLGWINLHFSLLPRWRGAAPVQRAIMAGDRVTGVSVFQLVQELDAGDVFSAEEQPIDDDETAHVLLQRLSGLGAGVLVGTVAALADGTAVARPQHGPPTSAGKLSLDDARMDWMRPAAAVYDRYRGVTTEPGAFTTIDGTRLKVLEMRRVRGAASPPPGVIRSFAGRVLVGTVTEPLELVRVQPFGRTGMPAADWWRGVTADEVIAR